MTAPDWIAWVLIALVVAKGVLLIALAYSLVELNYRRELRQIRRYYR